MKKLVFLFLLLFLFLFPAACSTYVHEGLVGTWYLELPGSPYFISITFNDDATGTRSNGLSDELFAWGARRDNLHISRRVYLPGEIRDERWTFFLGDDQLVIASRQVAAMDYLFNRADLNQSLAGMWENNYHLINLHPNGIGQRHVLYTGEVETLRWSTGGGVLNFRFDGLGSLGMMHERWAYTVTANSFTIVSQQADNFVLTYVRAFD